jgi:hypothetical protein
MRWCARVAGVIGPCAGQAVLALAPPPARQTCAGYAPPEQRVPVAVVLVAEQIELRAQAWQLPEPAHGPRAPIAYGSTVNSQGAVVTPEFSSVAVATESPGDKSEPT